MFCFLDILFFLFAFTGSCFAVSDVDHSAALREGASLATRTEHSVDGEQQRHLVFENELFLVSETCRVGMIALYNNSQLLGAYSAYDATEETAFQDSCSDVPLDGSVEEYTCNVQIDQSVKEAFESACRAAGGIVAGDYPYGVGIECCGEPNGDFLVYGYSTRDKRACVADTCNEAEYVRFLPQNIFNAGTQKFPDEIGLTCGAGCGCGCVGGCDVCPPRDCAEETAEFAEDVEIQSTRIGYYAALAQAFGSCLQGQAANTYNIECTDFTVDQSKVDLYEAECNNANGILALSEPVDIDCTDEQSSGRIRIAFDGTYVCVSDACDLEMVETQNLITNEAQFSPSGVFQDYVAGAETAGLTCGGDGGPPRDCAEETAKFAEDVEIQSTRIGYYASLTQAFGSCLQDQSANTYNFECTDFTVDQSKVDLYEAECNNANGILALSEPVDIDCTDEQSSGRIRIAFDGTYVCVSDACDLETVETQNLLTDEAQFSPSGVFQDYVAGAEAAGLTCGGDDDELDDDMTMTSASKIQMTSWGLLWVAFHTVLVGAIILKVGG